MTKNNVTWWEKFSPTIMETEVPQKFIDIINNTGDEVLKDDGLSKNMTSLIILWVKFIKRFRYLFQMKIKVIVYQYSDRPLCAILKTNDCKWSCI